MNILTSQASIEAAISTMNPVASEAAKLLAHRLLEDLSILQSRDRLQQEWLQSCAISAKRSGMDDDDGRFGSFLENHGDGVANVAVSIALFVVKEHDRKKKWGWIGTAAAVLGGAALGIFFS